MFDYVLLVMAALCPRCSTEFMRPVADAIVEVAPDRVTARRLAVVAFVETGFSRRRGVVPFGATAYRRRHPNATLVELAQASLASLRLGNACGGFAAGQVMYLTGRCRAHAGAHREARRRAAIERRIAYETLRRSW